MNDDNKNQSKSDVKITSPNSGEHILTPAQRARIERNRQAALLLKQARLIPHPYAKINTADSVEKSVIKVQGSKFIDTGGGFLLEQKDGEDQNEEPITLTPGPAPIMEPDRPVCEECQETFEDSYLFQNFEHSICDSCRDHDEKHRLITKTDAKNVYMLKDCDLEKREPVLKFIMKKNPHNVRWGTMKLYLELQVEKRALEVWGSEEQLEAERERREEERAKSKMKKYNKQLKALRMSVRSSLYDRTNKSSHVHQFGPETFNEEDDTYSHTCTTCSYSETFEKM
ncbi:DNA repair protein complementing XP-A cells homolog [Periplaneta americana]|uniref:DNA repair protein complementing XP-A cells homolog n=1 Tax=Periplaneta americana TaxID=6978 RepID=UPI0037E98C1A